VEEPQAGSGSVDHGPQGFRGFPRGKRPSLGDRCPQHRQVPSRTALPRQPRALPSRRVWSRMQPELPDRRPTGTTRRPLLPPEPNRVRGMDIPLSSPPSSCATSAYW
jgi:hypothetical protein